MAEREDDLNIGWVMREGLVLSLAVRKLKVWLQEGFLNLEIQPEWANKQDKFSLIYIFDRFGRESRTFTILQLGGIDGNNVSAVKYVIGDGDGIVIAWHVTALHNHELSEIIHDYVLTMESGVCFIEKVNPFDAKMGVEMLEDSG